MKDFKDAVIYSTNNKNNLLNSKICGCYYCQEIFDSSKIKQWIDYGETAVCPHCGIDSVIGDLSGYDISEQGLENLNGYWF